MQEQAVASSLYRRRADIPVTALPVLKCYVMLQRKTDGPPIDEECGDAVESGHAGLCQ